MPVPYDAFDFNIVQSEILEYGQVTCVCPQRSHTGERLMHHVGGQPGNARAYVQRLWQFHAEHTQY